MAIETHSSPTAPGPAPLRSAPARDRLAGLFPDPAAPATPWWKRRRRVIVGVVAIAVIASLVLATQAFGAQDSAYRTATVARHPVDARLYGVATIEPVSQASVAFPASGTVATVNVAVGDTVAAGQALATLDPDELTQSLHEAEATLAQAELALRQALNGETVSGNGANGGDGGSGDNTIQLTAASIPGPTNPTGSTGATGSSGSLADAQHAVLDAQQDVDAVLVAATEALDAASTVCAAAGVGTNGPTPPTTGALTACQTATNAVLTAQRAVSAAQQHLAEASRTLDALLAEQAAAAATADGSNDGRAPTDGSTGAPTDGSSAPASESPSAADLVAYQKAVDAADAEVAVAEQAIAQATIASPIAGTVEAVNLALGDAVDAASTTANVVVVGDGGYEATTTVSVDEITDVKVGQRATLLPDGSKRALEGTVTKISIAPDANASSTSYRVIIGLSDPHAALDNGSTGSVAIITESSRTGLAVPTSAVTTIGNRHTVTVLDGTTTERVAVQVGVVGDTRTEITGGVTAGQTVVLADLDEPLPGSATASSDSNSPTGPGGFPTGGPPGGFFRAGGPGR